MDSIQFQLLLTAIVTAFVSLGIPKLVDAWQKHNLTKEQKQFDHALKQDDDYTKFLMEQVTKWQLRVEDLENNKFAAIRDDIANLIIEISPCRDLMSELLKNRAATQHQSSEILTLLGQLQTQGEAIKFIGERIGIDKRKMDRSGVVAIGIDALSESGKHKIHPRPDEGGE